MRCLLLLLALLCSNLALGQAGSLEDRLPTRPTPREAALVAEVLSYEHEPISANVPQGATMLFDGWNETMLTPQFAPPQDAPRLVHFSDGKTYDTLSVEYLADEYKVRVVQTRFFLVMTITTPQEPPASLQAATQFVPGLLARIFREQEKLNVSVREMEGGFCGAQPPRRRPPGRELDMANANWTHTIGWWMTGRELRVLGVKIQPRSSLIITDTPYWFRFYEPAPEQ